MASLFEQMNGTAIDLRFAQLGQPETFTPAGGSSVAVTIIAGPEDGQLMENAQTREMYRHRLVEMRTSQVTATAQRGDVLTIAGENWTVESEESRRAGVATVNVVIPERMPTEGRRVQK